MSPSLRMSDSSTGVRTSRCHASVVLLATLVVTLACRHESKFAQAQDHATLQVESSSFTGGSIPSRFTCDGAGISPALKWSAPPARTESLAIIVHDPDAPIDFLHWIVFDIPPGIRSLAEGASTQGAMPQGAMEGTNDFGSRGYGGPCPPGGRRHHYRIHVYALDARFGLPPGASRRQLESAMDGHILAEGEIVGVYRRAGQ